MAKALAPPDLNIPRSEHTVSVSIIDTTAFIKIPAARFVEPPLGGHESLLACCYAFLVKHKVSGVETKYDTLLFDLGLRKDFENSPKVLLPMLEAPGVEVSVEKSVVDILREHGDDPSDVGGIIWSHWHFDHNGDPSTFPTSTDLIVGPGFKENFVPGYPTNEQSPVDEKAWEGRTLREIDFDTEGQGLKLGGYNAVDFYGDGSFYLLDTPGHAIGHMCGLARTSADPPEFIFMGGDIAHHGGEFRPTKYVPLPENIVPNPLVASYTREAGVCPGSIFEAIHPQKSSTEPFYNPQSGDGAHHDPKETKRSIEKLEGFDAQDGVFINLAHDSSLESVIELYPKLANGWAQKRWKQEGRWRFLRDFDTGVEAYKPV